MMTKRTKVAALAEHGATEGERAAAEAALERLPRPRALIVRDKRKRLTGKVVKDLPKPAQGNKIYRDGRNERGNDYVPGFGVRVTSGGARSFVLCYVAKGVERRMTIGSWPALSVEVARAEARKLAAKVELGGDPLQAKREERGEQTVGVRPVPKGSRLAQAAGYAPGIYQHNRARHSPCLWQTANQLD